MQTDNYYSTTSTTQKDVVTFEFNDNEKLNGQQFCLAAWNNNLRVLERLIDQVRTGENLAGYGPTHFAVSLGNVEVLEFLLANGIDKNERDIQGNSALMWVVASNGSEGLMDALVDHGADVNLQNFVGETALYLSCVHGFVDKVEYLLENGANPNIETLDGATALHAAAVQGNVAIIDLLVQYGVHLNASDNEGDSPLHWAVREAKTEAIKRLIEMGANPDMCNDDGETALDLASSLEDNETVNTLSYFGTKIGSNLSSAFSVEVEVVELERGSRDLPEYDLAGEIKALRVQELPPSAFPLERTVVF